MSQQFKKRSVFSVSSVVKKITTENTECTETA